MVDTTALDLANFLARNRQAGGVNAQLADALSANLAGAPSAVAPTPAVQPGLFGVGNTPSDRGDLGGGFTGGGNLLTLAAFLAGPATAVPSMIAGLVANDALGNPPSTSLFGAARSLFGREREGRRDISRPDRIRSASNREAGGGFVE